MAEWQLPKLYMAVRFRSPALKNEKYKIYYTEFFITSY